MRNTIRNSKGTDIKSIRTWALALAAAGMAISGPFPALAEEDRTPVEEVSLDVESAIEVRDTGSDVSVTTDSDECYVSNVDVTNEPNGEWKHKDKPKVQVSLEAERDYYFKSGFAKRKIKLTGSGGDVTSVRRKSDEELIVTITLDALKADDNDYDLDTEDAEWNEFSAVGEWGDSEDAAYYELRLYRNEKFVTTIRPVKETHYDFSKYIDSAGSYRFEVRGLYNSSRKGEWQESDIFEVTAEKAAEIQTAASYKQSGSGPAAGTWKNDAVGWWYCNSDGSYVKNNWQQIDGKWYFFDENGYRKTGWVSWKEQWYFLNENGEMLTNSVTPDGKYVGEDGVLAAQG